MEKIIDEKIMKDTARRVCNWGKWGKEDEIGTLNYVNEECIIRAAALVKKGMVFQLGMNLDTTGPQNGASNERFNPVHTMLWSGVDAVSGRELYHHGPPKDHDPELPWYSTNFSDDLISMPLQAATHWDALAHIFYRDLDTGEIFLWNGRKAEMVDSAGCWASGIDKYGTKMAGRGVLLDIARFKNVDYMLPGEGITAEDLECCARAEGVEIQRGDFLLIRTGDADRRIREGKWGEYADVRPGVEFETICYFHDKEVAAIAADTYGVEVSPNRSLVFDNPFHWLALPMCGMPLGENFRLDELAKDCEKDGVYEFMFVSPPLLVTNGTASPLNPYVIK
ncbi:MAG: cyclase family protein [Eubacteriales bacterium]|nr:cyclase family protein [Eubacteriales bacterium]